MTPRRVMAAAAGWGAVTAAALAAGPGTLAGWLALVHLGVVVGAPLAALLTHQVRTVAVMVVLSVALSLAVSALAAQVLVWFGLASPVVLVVTATAYGVVVAALIPTGAGGWVGARSSR